MAIVNQRKHYSRLARAKLKGRNYRIPPEVMCAFCGYKWLQRTSYGETEDTIKYCPNCNSRDIYQYDEEVYNKWKDDGNFK